MPVNDPHNDNDDGNQRKSDKRFLQGGEVSLLSVNEPHNNHVCLNRKSEDDLNEEFLQGGEVSLECVSCLSMSLT